MAVTRVKSPEEIGYMREGGGMLAAVLALLRAKLQPGMTSKDLAYIAAKELQALGGKPAFLGYQGFPDVLCVSINEEVVHGIPSKKRIIREGDIVSMDFGVLYRGLITDAAISTLAGKSADGDVDRLLKMTERALMAGIDAVKPGAHIGDISCSIEAVLQQHHFGIVRDLVGHGVGDKLHEDPNIPNYGRKGTGIKLVEGMTIAIEPMATLGEDDVLVAPDAWTVSTRDKSLSAHFEHTVAVCNGGVEILTAA